MDHFPTSEANFEPPSTGRATIGVASLAFQVGPVAVADIIRGKVIPTSTRKIQSSVSTVVRQYTTRNRTPDSDSEIVNPYEDKNFEFINDVLHNIYPTNHKGFIVRDHFNIIKANRDIQHLRGLKKGSVVYDETLIFIEMWINKIKNAVKEETEQFEAFIL